MHAPRLRHHRRARPDHGRHRRRSLPDRDPRRRRAWRAWVGALAITLVGLGALSGCSSIGSPAAGPLLGAVTATSQSTVPLGAVRRGGDRLAATAPPTIGPPRVTGTPVAASPAGSRPLAEGPSAEGPTASVITPGPSRARQSAPTGIAVPLPHLTLAGVNEVACRSTDPPVVLLHGTFSTVARNFSSLVPALRRSGRCVYGLNYGHDATAAVTGSARSVASFVGTVRAVTGARQVDVVGFSQGGLVLRTALRLDGLAPDVRVAVLIAPSFHGTTSSLASALAAAVCPACADQAFDSPLLRRLNAGGDLDGTVRYAVVSTTDDTVVTPMRSQVPDGPPSRVRSVTVQRQCPGMRVDHASLPGNAGVVHWVVAALADAGRPPDSALTCG